MKIDLSRQLEHLHDPRRRRWIVTILTLTVALAGILPAADEYRELTSRHAQLTGELAATQKTVERLPAAELQLTNKQQQLATLESQTTGEEQVQELREQILGITRDSGCQLRKIRFSEPVSRAWNKGDSVLDQTNSRNLKSPYQLQSRSLQLTVSGEITNIQTLLARLQELDKMSHTKQFMLRPVDANRDKEVVLEIDLQLFDLTPAKAAA